MSRVFVYGSLLRGLHNHHVIESATFLRTAKTREAAFRLVDGKSGYPFALDSSDADAAAATSIAATESIVGELWEVTPPVLDALDSLEGHPSFYRRREVALENDAEPAWMYLLYDREFLKRVTTFPDVQPAGDWRAFHAPQSMHWREPPGTWLTTRMSHGAAGRVAVFCCIHAVAQTLVSPVGAELLV
jgi:gamma-glutamylaminecyclotransferase